MLVAIRQWFWRLGAWVQQKSCAPNDQQICDTCGLSFPDGCQPRAVLLTKEMLEYEVESLREENRKLQRSNSTLRRTAATAAPVTPKRRGRRGKNT